ncbi:hypothetical protein P7H60_13675 [Vagococcus carniphilus]|uniref:hypothetical protein n=1 Tax=Vagococcus carniphilus TaxID=218144 RepID=UPI00288FF66D|nr:hypothetical protein [Vagococcus carniphilus]MDT2850199.1 hypothetical protein [Vagococcus carniphilus]
MGLLDEILKKDRQRILNKVQNEHLSSLNPYEFNITAQNEPFVNFEKKKSGKELLDESTVEIKHAVKKFTDGISGHTYEQKIDEIHRIKKRVRTQSPEESLILNTAELNLRKEAMNNNVKVSRCANEYS